MPKSHPTRPSWQRRHEAVLLYLVDHPAARCAEIARATGYGVTHISRILNSPEFRRRYDELLSEARRNAARRYFERLQAR